MMGSSFSPFPGSKTLGQHESRKVRTDTFTYAAASVCVHSAYTTIGVTALTSAGRFVVAGGVVERRGGTLQGRRWSGAVER
jgi:hypothetical protein